MKLHFLIVFMNIFSIISSEKIEELYQYLMSNYNKHVRPVENNSDILTVKVGVKLVQIDDVNEINQIMQTHVYVLH
ncbi:unnamed protein product, partial [Adineta steineri]